MTWWRRRGREWDLDREIRADLELEAEEQGENGLSAEEAYHAARRAFGNVTGKPSLRNCAMRGELCEEIPALLPLRF
jgi:hypothetical protein